MGVSLLSCLRGKCQKHKSLCCLTSWLNPVFPIERALFFCIITLLQNVSSHEKYFSFSMLLFLINTESHSQNCESRSCHSFMCKDLSSVVTHVKEMFYPVNCLCTKSGLLMSKCRLPFLFFTFIIHKAPMPTYVIGATQLALSV